MSAQRRGDLDIPTMRRQPTTTLAPTKPKPTTENEILVSDPAAVVTITVGPFTKDTQSTPKNIETDNDNQQKITPTSKSRKEVTYNEAAGKSTNTQKVVPEKEKSIDNSDDQVNINYIIAGTAVGAVAVIATMAIALGVLASKGYFTPKGFAPVETAV